MAVLSGLEPAAVFHYFEEICGIPHISYHEKALSDYCVRFAQQRGLYYEQDEMGNVLIVAPATEGYEQQKPLILQGHLDMVGDKTPDCPLDLEKEPIRLMVDGGCIRAQGTTLGADDGIAVAYALAVLDAKDIPHPKLEVVLTVSEEVGLLGASAMDLSSVEGRMLINIDSEEEGVLTAGCAGGRRVDCHIPVEWETAAGQAVELCITGLNGGHSGLEIHKGRANAIVLMGRLLDLVAEKTAYRIVAVAGGVKPNVIPKESRVTLLLPQGAQSALEEACAAFKAQMEAEYGTADPGIRVECRWQDADGRKVLTQTETAKVRQALLLAPCGVQAMSMDVPGLVETSLNLGVLELGDELFLGFSIRSAVPSAKVAMTRKVQTLTGLLGGSTEVHGDYPAWVYARQSALRDRCVAVFEQQYAKKPQIQTMHAGLECGILCGKLEELDCISFGPDLRDVHTPNESVEIASVERVWRFLKGILAYKD